MPTVAESRADLALTRFYRDRIHLAIDRGVADYDDLVAAVGGDRVDAARVLDQCIAMGDLVLEDAA